MLRALSLGTLGLGFSYTRRWPKYPMAQQLMRSSFWRSLVNVEISRWVWDLGQ
jgi:hypothetical protein